MRRILWSFILLALLAATGCPSQKRQVVIGGGPVGGTFQHIAEGIASVLEAEDTGIRSRVERSGGSLANMRGLEAGQLDMALVYAGDVYLGSQDRLTEGTFKQLRAMARLYGASAQLAVPVTSPVKSPFDLRGRRVAIGSPGSGAALSAERFFRVIGIWNTIVPIHVGYTMGINDLISGRVQAVWELVGVPSASLGQASRRFQLRLIDLEEAAVAEGLYERYPFYTSAVIPAGTYGGQPLDIATFQDSALLVAAAGLDEELVYNSLVRLFNEEGLARMRPVHPAAADLDLAKGLIGIRVPLHPGAKRFWLEQKVSLPEGL